MFLPNVPKRSLWMFPECSREKFYECSLQMLSECSYGRVQECSLWIFSEYCCGTFSQYTFWTFLERSTGIFSEHCFGTLKKSGHFLSLGTFHERFNGTFRTFHGNVHRTSREGIVLWRIDGVQVAGDELRTHAATLGTSQAAVSVENMSAAKSHFDWLLYCQSIFCSHVIAYSTLCCVFVIPGSHSRFVLAMN